MCSHRKSNTKKYEKAKKKSCSSNKKELTSVNIRQTAVLCHLDLSFNRCDFRRGFMCGDAGWSRNALRGKSRKFHVDFSRVYAPSLRSHEQRKHQVDFHSVFHPCVARFSSGQMRPVFDSLGDPNKRMPVRDPLLYVLLWTPFSNMFQISFIKKGVEIHIANIFILS